jgi:hypothetical protein
LLAHGWWFSPGILSSYTTKTGRHDIAEILLKVALSTKNQLITTMQSNLSIVNYGDIRQVLLNTGLIDLK